MRYADLYESEFLTNEDDIIEYMKKIFTGFYPVNLTIEPDGLVYMGDLGIINNRTTPKLKVRFKLVSGYFMCRDSSIMDLEGFPQSVSGNFYCNNTNITSLKHCPKLVEGGFYCYDTEITNPKEYRYVLYSEIKGYFDSGIDEIDNIINPYRGSANRKHWPYAINLLSKVQL